MVRPAGRVHDRGGAEVDDVEGREGAERAPRLRPPIQQHARAQELRESVRQDQVVHRLQVDGAWDYVLRVLKITKFS